MRSIRLLRYWRAAATCLVVIIGMIDITPHWRSGNRTLASAENVQTLPFWIEHHESATMPWNRYRAFRYAYMRTVRLAPNTSGLSDFIMSNSNREDMTNVIPAFFQVVRTTPEEDGAWSNLAWLYAMGGDTAKAISTEQKAISLYRYDYTYYVLLGAFFEHSGEVSEAKGAYINALVLYPRLASSNFWHSLNTRHPDVASTAMKSALETLDQNDLLSDDIDRKQIRARLLIANNQEHEADEIVRLINSQLPMVSGSWELQGELSEKNGEIAEAGLDYRRAMFLDRTDPLPHQRLALLKLNDGSLEDARAQTLLAWKLTKLSRSSGSARRTVQYQQENGPRNGMLPTVLLRDTQPSFDYASIFTRLAAAFSSRGDEENAGEMEDLAEEADSQTDSNEAVRPIEH